MGPWKGADANHDDDGIFSFIFLRGEFEHHRWF
jgi:hypothetical protein